MRQRRYAENTINSYLGVLKIFFNFYKDKPIEEISKHDIQKMLGSIGNLKHRTALAIVYGLGLRRGELINLKLSDIDSKRKTVIIRNAKGSKDRALPIPNTLLDLIIRYYKAYKPVMNHRHLPTSFRFLYKLSYNRFWCLSLSLADTRRSSREAKRRGTPWLPAASRQSISPLRSSNQILRQYLERRIKGKPTHS